MQWPKSNKMKLDFSSVTTHVLIQGKSLEKGSWLNSQKYGVGEYLVNSKLSTCHMSLMRSLESDRELGPCQLHCGR